MYYMLVCPLVQVHKVLCNFFHLSDIVCNKSYTLFSDSSSWGPSSLNQELYFGVSHLKNHFTIQTFFLFTFAKFPVQNFANPSGLFFVTF